MFCSAGPALPHCPAPGQGWPVRGLGPALVLTLQTTLNTKGGFHLLLTPPGPPQSRLSSPALPGPAVPASPPGWQRILRIPGLAWCACLGHVQTGQSSAERAGGLQTPCRLPTHAVLCAELGRRHGETRTHPSARHTAASHCNCSSNFPVTTFSKPSTYARVAFLVWRKNAPSAFKSSEQSLSRWSC